MQRLEDIDKSLFRFINEASNNLLDYFNLLLIQNGFNMNTQEWILLSHIIEHPGKNQKWYGDNILKDKTTTMRLVDTLEKKRLIERVADGTDRRHNLLYSTEEGKHLIEQTIPFINDAFQSIFSDIETDQLIATMNVLKEVIGRLSLFTK
jgi:DNA-binding MarR family transcriptional regulator